MAGSIDPRCETVRGTHWPKKVAWLFGTRVAETILASGSKRPHQQAGHIDASDPIRPEKLLRHGGRPHMGPRVRGDDHEVLIPARGIDDVFKRVGWVERSDIHHLVRRSSTSEGG